jgi:hypothetical protein
MPSIELKNRSRFRTESRMCILSCYGTQIAKYISKYVSHSRQKSILTISHMTHINPILGSDHLVILYSPLNIEHFFPENYFSFVSHIIL